MRESKIEQEVCEYAKSQGWLVYKFSSPSNRGVPDRVFIRRGKVIFIEFKATGKKPTKLQKKIVDKIKAEEIEVHFCDDIEQGKNIFKLMEI